MKRRLRKQARKLLWLVDGDFAALRDRFPALWARILTDTRQPGGSEW